MVKKTIYIISILAVAGVLTACGTAAAAKELNLPTTEETPPLRTISVSGSGKAVLTPDIAYVNIGVQTEDPQASNAVSKNNQLTQKVIDALLSMGVAEKDIQTTNFSIYPQVQYDNNGKPTGEIKYQVNNSIYVTVRDLDQIGSLLDTVVKAGANTINGIQFDVSDKTEALATARKNAVENAKTIAEELTQAANVTLGAVQSIVYTRGVPPVPIYKSRGMEAEMAVGASNVPISPGEMVINVDVNIVYQIK